MEVVIVMIFSHCAMFHIPSLRASRSNLSSGASMQVLMSAVVSVGSPYCIRASVPLLNNMI